VTRVVVYKNLGAYNWAQPQDKQWQVVVEYGDHKISQVFPREEEPSISCPPSEVIEQISTQLESLWICTSRDEKRRVIAEFRKIAEQMDSDWAKQKIASLEKNITELRQYVIDYD
jgi:hypothetical protein